MKDFLFHIYTLLKQKVVDDGNLTKIFLKNPIEKDQLVQKTDKRTILCSEAAKLTKQSFTVQTDIAAKHNSNTTKDIFRQRSGMLCNGNAKSVTWPDSNWAAFQMLNMTEGKMPQEQAWNEIAVIEAWQSITTEKTAPADIYGFQQSLTVKDLQTKTKFLMKLLN